MPFMKHGRASLSGNIMRAIGSVDDYALNDGLACFHQISTAGFTAALISFAACEKAYPGAMAGIVCAVDRLRDAGCDITIELPEHAYCKRLFSNTNWAHFLDPRRHPQTDVFHDRHVSLKRFADIGMQQKAVDETIDVVMRSMELPRDVIAGLEWSLNEITDNVLNHARSPTGGLVQATTFTKNRQVQFVVADPGDGILSAMRSAFPEIARDVDAIGEAVKAGVTSRPEAGQGNGLAGTLRIATLSGGSFKLSSGRGRLSVYGTESKNWSVRVDQTFVGTLVEATLGLDGSFHLADALALDGAPHQPVDIIELKYESASNAEFVLRLKDETVGFGTRGSGRQVRTKCLNLLAADRNKALMLDWEGVPLISSSFADESIGKLFVQLGPIAFGNRVRHSNMDGIVRTLLDNAILQRASQSARGISIEQPEHDDGDDDHDDV